MSPDLAADLWTLHRAGRLTSPWAAGMWTDHHVRVLDTVNDGYPGLIRVADDEQMTGWEHPRAIGNPDPADPATIGCLLALLREATGSPTVYVLPRPGTGWTVVAPDPAWGQRGPTEADALVAAIHALAEECRR